MEKVLAIIEVNSGGYHSIFTEHEFPGFGVFGYGNTEEEAITDFKEAFAELKEMAEEKGQTVADVEFEFKYDMPSFLQYYAYTFTLPRLERITGVHRTTLVSYIDREKKPNRKVAQKIEQNIRAFGQVLSNINFA